LRVLLVLIVPVFPFLELWGVVLASRAFGLWFLLYLLLMAVIGIVIIRQERVRMGPRLQAMLTGGTAPLSALLYTFRRLVAGILFVIPGALSDILAVILLLLPEPKVTNETGAAGDPQVIDGEFRDVTAANDGADPKLPDR
jgi:UPF0716 protein FxsA